MAKFNPRPDCDVCRLITFGYALGLGLGWLNKTLRAVSVGKNIRHILLNREYIHM